MSRTKSQVPETSVGDPACPLCLRTVIDPRLLSDHHLVPRSRGGRKTEAICTDCHGQIHAMYSNRQLVGLCSVDALMADPMFARFVEWISGRPFGGMVKARQSRGSRRRGRGG
jgi:hypothetical protein